MRYIIFICILIFSCQQKQKSSKEADNKVSYNKVFFKNISNGDTLVNPILIEMGVLGMKIKPAGKLEPGTGHHHILINKNSMPYGEIIPMDEQHLHYGKGDTTTTINLPSGHHVLTLQFANGMHASYGEQFSNTINVYIK